jgi:alkylhydroperoxidase family enzyme
MAWIRTLSDAEAEGHAAKLFDEARRRSGRVAGIVRLMSPEPATLDASMRLYVATTTSPRSPLPRWFRELIAVEVSRANDCSY